MQPEAAAKPPLMYELIREQADLAVAYAEDGAYLSALRVLSHLTEEVRAHTKRLRDAGIM